MGGYRYYRRGKLDRFVIAFRVYGQESPTVYYDSLSITYDGTLFIQEEPETTGDVYDFDGNAFNIPTATNSVISSTDYLSSSVSDTSQVPSGFSDGVYTASHKIYSSTWVQFNGKLDLSKITSLRVRMYISSYTLESGKTPAFRIFGSNASYVQQLHDGTYDQWFELELLSLLQNDSVSKNGDGTLSKFLLALRAYGTTDPTVYYDSIIIEGTDYYTEISTENYTVCTPTTLLENISGKSTDLERWDAYFSTSDNAALPGTPWVTQFTNVNVTINNKEYYFNFWRADDSYGLFIDMWYATLPGDTSYAKIVIKAGTYDASDGSGGIIIENDFTYYLYNEDLWNSPPPADFTVDVSFEKISSASSVSGSDWNLYPTPYNAALTPGTPWTSSWANVAYEIDGISYTGTMKRANNSEGMYLSVPGTQLSPAADGVTFTIKAGSYVANATGDPGICITEDFTFYIIKGSPTTEFDFDDPAFIETVYCDVDNASYVVTDADTVTIDGKTYSQGDIYDTIGTHTLTYTMYNREYSRTLVIYRIGESGDTENVDVIDLMRIKRHLAEMTTLTESGKWGADMNSDGEITKADVSLHRKMLVMGSGMLILCPESGITALKPSEYVADLETDYDLTASATAAMKNGTELYHRSPLVIKWLSAENVSEYKVYVGTKADFSDALIHTTNKTQYTLINLLPATTYYWKIAAGDVESDVRSFTTADTIRTLTIDGVDNTRDIGGYDALDGKKMKYGMVYRSATLDDITTEGLYQMNTVLGIKTDLDVRTPGEGTAGSGSPLGSNTNYLNYDAPYYWDKLVSDSYRAAIIGEIKAFANEDNYPIVVHCSVGRDRTGTLLFVIEGLCGMSKSDLFLEYELSFLGRIGGGASANVPQMMNYVETMYQNIQAYAPEDTFAEACESFVLSLGITQEEIDTIRDLMTE